MRWLPGWHGRLRRSHIGWAFRALRDDEVAAELTGIDVARYWIYGALIGAAMLGLAGSTYAFTEGRISPTTFGFGDVDVVVLVMLAFGGIGTFITLQGEKKAGLSMMNYEKQVNLYSYQVPNDELL